MIADKPQAVPDASSAIYNLFYRTVAEHYADILQNPAYPLHYQFPQDHMPARWNSGDYGPYTQFITGDTPPLAHGLYYLGKPNGSAYASYADWVRSLPPQQPGAQKALRDLEDPRYKTTYKRPGRSDLTAGRLYIGGDLWNLEKDLEKWRLGQYDQSGLGPALFILSAQDLPWLPPIDELETSAELVPFFSATGEAMVSSCNITAVMASDEQFRLELSLSATRAYPIERDDWFSLELLEQCHSDSPDSALYFDREHGTLALIPAYIVVGFNPSARITLSPSVYDRLKTQLTAADLHIGPFSMAGYDVKVTESAQSVVVTLTRASVGNADPEIMGYIHYFTCLDA